MPRLTVNVPGEAERTLELQDGLVVGRDEACGLFIPEKKASRRHLRFVRVEDAWAVEDLDSSNGTYVGDDRVLRRLLTDGDVVRVGDSTLAFGQPRPTGPLVGGRLLLKATEPLPAPAAPAPVAMSAAPAAEPAEEPEAPRDVVPRDPSPRDPGTRPLHMPTFGRALGLFVLAVAVLAGVHVVLGAKARDAADESTARKALEDLLAKSAVDARAFEVEADHWLKRFPKSPDRALLERHRASVGARAKVRTDVEARFETLMARLGSLPEDQVRVGLLALKRELAEDTGLAERVRLAFVELDRRRAARERTDAERVRGEAQQLLAQGLPGPALAKLAAWRAGRGLLTPEIDTQQAAAEAEALAAVRTLAATTHAAAQVEKDPERRRRLLAAAWPALAGTSEQEPLADALRFLARPPQTTPGAGSRPAGTSPEAAAEALLARAAQAEQLFGQHRWDDAKQAFEGLLKDVTPGPLATEWRARLGDLDRVFGLVDALGRAAGGAKPPRVALAAGAAHVSAADRKGVTLDRAGTATTLAWNDVPADDLVLLLTPAKPDVEQRLALAVLAASLGKPEGLVAAVAPLYEAGSPGAQVDALVARLMEGRAEAPPGGYRLHKGRLLDGTQHAAVLEEERLDALTQRAGELLVRLGKEPALKKLDRMRELRAELDRRRLRALLAIFNETHYPYPADKGRPPYTHVQAEIDRRVAAVREVWEGEESVKLSRTGTVGALVEEIEAAVKDLDAKGRDVAALEADLDRIAPYMTGTAITVREFALDAKERDLLAYNRWVMRVLNPGRTAVAVGPELEQVSVTNAYRTMMGFTCTVTPGDAAYSAIDDTNVAKVLDAGVIVPHSIVPLKAVRVDDRLITSARAHSIDMQKRSFFDHFAPPNPATGALRTSPFDRMRTAGYEGHGASENICMGAGDPTAAHTMWCHSSGHHRNILSSWDDMGTGLSGAHWTQNFGLAGGRPTVIEAPTTPSGPARR